MFYPIRKLVVVCLGLAFFSAPFSYSYAEDAVIIVIQDHRFVPAEVVIPAGKKVKLTIQNQDKTQEEFESYDLNREEIIDGGQSLDIFIGPLKPGKYAFFGEFNPDTAQGTIVVQ